MRDFSADWLALREPHDSAARAQRLEETLESALSGGDGISVLDLGCGTGANLRHLAPRLPCAQDWLLLDNDETLLAAARGATAGWARNRDYVVETAADGSLRLQGARRRITVRFQRHDLSRSLPSFKTYDLVTASALFDLVSRDWVESLAATLAASSACGLFVLTFDGRAEWRPGCEADARVSALFGRHQRRDKGFGPALGPEAALRAVAAFARQGLAVEEAESDWRLGPEDVALQQALLAGWATAAREAAPEEGMLIESWLMQRCDLIVSGLSACMIGHRDFLVLPNH